MNKPTGKLKFAYETITNMESKIKLLQGAIGEISISHQEPKDYGYYTECNGCQANLDKEQHEDDCPFIITGVVIQK